MAADHVVGEDFELGLVVHAGVLAEHERLALHAAVGLLGVLAHDDLTLEYSGRLVIEDVTEKLAADAIGHGVVDNQRRIRMLLAAQQRQAAERDRRMFALEPRENLTPHEACGRNEAEAVELRIGAHGDEQTVQGDRVRALLRHLRGIIHARAIADDHGQCFIRLRGVRHADRCRLVEHDGGARADNQDRAQKGRLGEAAGHQIEDR